MSDLSIKFDFNALHTGFTSRTGGILERAAFLLQASGAANQNSGHLVALDSAGLSFQPRSVDHVRGESERWILGCAFRDCLEEVQFFMAEVRQMCAAMSLLSIEDREIPITEYHEVVVGPGHRFEGRSFPGKVDYLRAQFGPDVLDGRIDHICTLNAARNCLVHRLGIVGMKDCDDTEQLVVRWEAPVVRVRRVDGTEVDLEAGASLEGGMSLVKATARIERVFRPGDLMVFSVADMSGIWMMLHSFGVETARGLASRGAARGLIFQPATDSTPT